MLTKRNLIYMNNWLPATFTVRYAGGMLSVAVQLIIPAAL